MTRHLSPDQLIDLAEAAILESSAPHLESCEACRRQLADMRAMMSAASEVAVPEPSPLVLGPFLRAGTAGRRPRRRAASRVAVGAVAAAAGGVAGFGRRAGGRHHRRGTRHAARCASCDARCHRRVSTSGAAGTASVRTARRSGRFVAEPRCGSHRRAGLGGREPDGVDDARRWGGRGGARAHRRRAARVAAVVEGRTGSVRRLRHKLVAGLKTFATRWRQRACRWSTRRVL